jgi:hypothetical protein
MTKSSPARIRFKEERKQRRAVDPVVQAKARTYKAKGKAKVTVSA